MVDPALLENGPFIVQPVGWNFEESIKMDLVELVKFRELRWIARPMRMVAIVVECRPRPPEVRFST
jgi:hypothetical protein